MRLDKAHKKEKKNFLNGMTIVHNRGPKQLGKKEERDQVH